MAILIGTDEAGYGPNLGPLVVSASVWEMPDELLAQDLYSLLRPVVTSGATPDASRVPIADSKQLYKPGGGIEQLERGVLAVLGLTSHRVKTCRDVLLTLDAASQTCFDSLAWYAGYDAPIPRQGNPDEISRLGKTLQSGLEAANVNFLALRSAVVFPERLNDLIDEFDSKGTALSTVTIDLIRSIVESLGDSKMLVQCDKHGGRSKYGALLQQAFSEYLIEVRSEASHESVYRFGPRQRRIEIRFTAKGERCLPAALASMTSKYLRELAMEALNAFWCSRIEGLRPTAGYPLDAKRFKASIASVQQELGIPDRQLWRNR